MKFYYFLFFVLFTSFGLISEAIANNNSFVRTPLNQVLNKVLNEDEKNLIDKFFLKRPMDDWGVNYQINFERVEQYVLNLPRLYRDQVTVKQIGRYDGKNIQRIDIPGWEKVRRKN